MYKEKMAHAYKNAADQFDKIPVDQLHLFRKVINRQFGDFSKMIYFDFVDHEPYQYTTIDEMFEDFKKGTIKVNTTGNDSKVWGTVYNLMFRAVHDYFHCKMSLDFNFEDEYIAYQSQVQQTMWSYMNLKDFLRVDWRLFDALLRSEIVYQGAYKEVMNEFHIDQKIILDDLTNLK